MAKAQNEDIPQQELMDSLSNLGLDDDTTDELFNWCEENGVNLVVDSDEYELEGDDDLSDDLDDENSIEDEISQLEQTFANASHTKINDPVKMYLKEIGQILPSIQKRSLRSQTHPRWKRSAENAGRKSGS